IIDECHRSAWGKWSEVLTRNPNAVQIGLTATPRQLEAVEDSKEVAADLQVSADNIRHFGEPVYEYDIAQGIEDGYLAACEIQKGRVNLDDTGITIDEILARNPESGIPNVPRDEGYGGQPRGRGHPSGRPRRLVPRYEPGEQHVLSL